jgi:HEAT repeat protein
MKLNLYRLSCFGGLLLLAPLAHADGGSPIPTAARRPAIPDLRVTIQKKGSLTVDLRDAPLGDVLRAIGERAGVKIDIRGEPTTRVTQSFTGVALNEGIQKLARGHSLALIYRATLGRADVRELMEVVVIGRTPAEEERESYERVLANRAKDSDPVVRQQTAIALNDLTGPRAGAVATALLGDKVPVVRIEAIKVLAQLEPEGTAKLLRQLLIGDPDAAVRQAAAKALGLLTKEDTREALRAAASDRDQSVRREATMSLVRIEQRAQ